jgi:hypothetical protein
MPKSEDYPEDDEYGSSISGMINDNAEHTNLVKEQKRRHAESEATHDDVHSLVSSPLYVRKRRTELANPKHGFLDSDDDSTTEAVVAPVEYR